MMAADRGVDPQPGARHPGRVHLLCLDPYHGGSHAAFIDGWRGHSRHQWTVLALKPRHWRWRMRHAALTLARELQRRIADGGRWDALVCTDMLDLASLRGLAPAPIAALPTVVYFHENQLTYPVQKAHERDLHFAYTNATAALAADACWFNSRYHLDAFTRELAAWLARMPDHGHSEIAEEIVARARILSPGIDPAPPRAPRQPGPLRLLWAARWEYDKGPDDLFAALDLAAAAGVDFRLAVVGQAFTDHPAAFDEIRRRFGDRIDRWGYQPTPTAYRACLTWADVVLSTAHHEFFGIAVAEAVAAGCYPLLPDRLAYPERYGGAEPPFLYNGGPEGLATAIGAAAARLTAGDLWSGDPEAGRRRVADLPWPDHAPRLDAAIESVIVGGR